MTQPIDSRPCIQCGDMFEPATRQFTVCSDACRLARKNEARRKSPIRSCRECGAPFHSELNAEGMCGDACRAERIRKRDAARKRRPDYPPRKCFECGAMFEPVRRNGRTCGEACAAVRDERQRRDIANRRRARVNGALVHDVPDAMVWEFNPAGPGCCNYCRTALAFDDRKSWHVDHVVPISRGGPHEVSNLVIACARCNMSKGARLLSEWKPRAA